MKTRYKTILLSLIPAIIFMTAYRFLSFSHAVIIGFSVGIIIYTSKYMKNRKLTTFDYIGIFGLVSQTIISIVANNPKTYFIYPLVENGIYAIAIGISLIIGKDVISYIAKDFNNKEDPNEDCTPAYRRLSYLWMMYYIIKVIVKIIGISNWDFEVLYTVNWILSTPAGIFLIWLSFSYPEKYYIKNFGNKMAKIQEVDKVSDVT